MGLKIYFAAMLIFIATNNANAKGYLGNGEISVMQNAYGGWILSVNGDNNNPDGCSKTNVILENTHDQYKELYSMLLSSYVANKKININVNGCHSDGYKKLDFVYTKWN